MWMTGVLLWGMVLTIPTLVSAAALDTTDIPTDYDLDTTDFPPEYDLEYYDGGIEINDTEYYEMFDDENIFDNWNSTAERQVNVDKYWRDDNRCGTKKPVLSGNRKDYSARCKNGPCCSGGGWCGHSAAPWCECPDCTDYRCLSSHANPSYESDTATGNCECGMVNPTRIYGGGEVKPNLKYPWMVRLEETGNPDYLCGGSIVNDRWILTAAHCVVEDNSPTSIKCNLQSVDTVDRSKLRVWVGDHKIRVLNGNQVQSDMSEDIPGITKDYEIKTFKSHGKYDCTINDVSKPNFNVYDIALLELKTPITFGNMIRPVCLPRINDDKTYAGIDAIVTGWGRTGTGPSPFLKEVTVKITSSDNQGTDCRNLGRLPKIKLCAGGEAGEDSCGGDSGGPLVVMENNKYVQVGIVSYGDGCGILGNPGVYARITPEILQWIRERANYYHKI